MTRQAESLTVQIEGEQGVWAPRRFKVAKAEQRPIMPADFTQWFADQWTATQAGRLARILRLSRGPMKISTAVGLVVRLELRMSRLFRRWVAFSCIERECLEQWPLPGTTLERAAPYDHVRLVFDRADPPIAAEGQVELWPCQETVPLHAYRQRSVKEPRVVNLSFSGATAGHSHR